MRLPWKKDPEQDAQEEQDVQESQETKKSKKKEKKRKKNDYMRSVLTESVFDTVYDEMKGLPSSYVEGEGCLGLLLKAESIGGISKSRRNDEAISALVQAINTSSISVLITEEMLEDEEIVFIPTEETFEAMDEYSVLADAPYMWVLVHDDGSYHVVSEGSFDDFGSLARGDLLPSDIVDGNAGLSAEDVLVDNFGFNGSEEDSEPIIDNEEMYRNLEEMGAGEVELDDEPEEISEEISDNEPSDSAPIFDDDYDIGFVDDEDDEVLDEDLEEPLEESFDDVDDVVIERDVMNESFERVFSKDDLNLSVDYTAFDYAIPPISDDLLFQMQEADSWLDEYLLPIKKQANDSLKMLYTNKRNSMRLSYERLVEKVITEIVQSEDYLSESTRSGKRMNELADLKAESYGSFEDGEAVRIREKYEDEYAAGREDAIEDGKRKAAVDYDNRYKGKLDRDIERAITQKRDKIEQDYLELVDDEHSNRRMRAQQKLEQGEAVSLQVIGENWDNFLHDYFEEVRRFQDEMSEIIKEHREEDVAQRRVKELELSQRTKAEEVRQEYVSRMKTLVAEHESKEKSMDLQVKQLEDETRIKLERMKEEYDHSLSRRDKEIEDLTDRLGKEKEEAAFVVERERQRTDDVEEKSKRMSEDWEARLKQSESRTHQVMFFAVFISALIALSAVLVGYTLGIRAGERQQAIYQASSGVQSTRVIENQQDR